jgi:hypothetical protein
MGKRKSKVISNPEGLIKKAEKGIIPAIGRLAPMLEDNGTARISEPLLQQTIGKPRPKKGQPSEFEEFISNSDTMKEYCEESNIQEIGAELAVSESYSLSALASLFSVNNYDNTITVSVPEYLEAFGVNKSKNKKGYTVYSGSEREEALKALEGLEKPRLLHWKQRTGTDKKGEPLFDMVTHREPILKVTRLYQGLTEKQCKAISGGKDCKQKLTQLKITANEIFLYDSFVLYPKNLFNAIRAEYGKRVSKHFLAFVNLLLREAKHGTYTKEIGVELLADRLHLGYLDRQPKRRDKLIEEDIKKAKDIGLLVDVKRMPMQKGGEKYKLNLNKDFYPKPKRNKKALEAKTKD